MQGEGRWPRPSGIASKWWSSWELRHILSDLLCLRSSSQAGLWQRS
jgi:hypothetical protein